MTAAVRRGRSLLGWLAAGLLAGGLTVGAGLLVVGMGHGWGLPLRFGGLAMLLWPFAAARWGWVTRDTPWTQDAGLTALFVLPLLWAMRDLIPYPSGVPAAEWLVLLLPVAWWFAGRALARSGTHPVLGDALLLGIGLLLDAAAWRDFAASPSAQLYWASAIPWLLLWLGWQAMAVGTLLRRFTNRPSAPE